MQYKFQGKCEENIVKIIKRCVNSCHIKEEASLIVIIWVDHNGELWCLFNVF